MARIATNKLELPSEAKRKCFKPLGTLVENVNIRTMLMHPRKQSRNNDKSRIQIGSVSVVMFHRCLKYR